MGRVNWLSVLALVFMVMAGVALGLRLEIDAVAYAVLAVAAAILAHLR